MSLRIRRGTEAQRTGATFDLGEIVWTTDTQKLFVGDGVNAGGKHVLASSAGIGLVWNTATQRLDFNGSGSGILSVSADTAPTLGGNLNLNTRSIIGSGNINITGTVTATQFVGTRVSADTSPALGGSLNMSGFNITGTGNINITSGSMTVPQITPTQIVMPNLGSISGQQFSVSNPGITFVNSTPDRVGGWLNFYSTNSIGALAAPVNYAKSRGTIISPAAVQTNDTLGLTTYTGWTGSAFTQAAHIRVNAIGSIAAGVLPSSMTMQVNNSAGVVGDVLTLSSTSVKCMSPLLVPTYATPVARDAAITSPTAGMIIFLTSTTKFQGYTGGFWADLN
jgi:hypothetical protein